MAEQVLDRIKQVVGPNGWLEEPRDIEPYEVETRGLYHGKTALVVRPGSTEEVATVVRLCAEAGLPIVPQGGNTGLCGGGVPDEDGRNIVLALGRMNKVRSIDPANFTITVEAGVILADIQRIAAEHDRLFPLSLGAEGSCQIGGNLSTNAGGVQVLRYGNTRELTLGLEVVLPDGRIWNGLRTLRKDNTGYDLKQLFVGAEGTLGIITAATLRLYPKPRATATAFVALPDTDAVMSLFAQARAATGDQLTAFELIPRIGLEMAMKHVNGVVDPLEQPYETYALIEVSTASPHGDVGATLEGLLAEAFEAGTVVDGTIAASGAQRDAFWLIREGMVEGQRFEGGSIKHDIAVPVASVAEFLKTATAAVTERLPGIRPVAFGHCGDGNIHFNLSQPAGADKDTFLARWEEFNDIVHGIVAGLNGSISAEHGIGRLKCQELTHYKAPIELELMARVKQALDPKHIMNPGKVVAEAAFNALKGE
ncbi:D-2-hydroxyacid dehydrogenase [Aliidongia dinghuensis]|uniref:D-2-hydroxyacid dehydrogenase n=1 Tax=Aliidongia dinghuensis TaxID=1867774 RepID=A0A8J3E2P3_9PROT|nr:FAD-binding oxidoreductase [Aliidongia dinghuensis]GGF23107.1 D-2-hydroxyacid dehydrogenase [Aliidongia dinghuensis]